MQLVQVFHHFLMPRVNEKTENLHFHLYFEMIIGFIWTRSKYIYMWLILNPHLFLCEGILLNIWTIMWP